MLQPILMRNLDLIDDKMCKIASQDILVANSGPKILHILCFCLFTIFLKKYLR